MARQNGGHITRGEQRRINRQKTHSAVRSAIEATARCFRNAAEEMPRPCQRNRHSHLRHSKLDLPLADDAMASSGAVKAARILGGS
jgi:hypothetical protein